MNISGFPLPHAEYDCPYLKGQHAQTDNVYIQSIDVSALSVLLEHGYRHFGPYFFRPRCENCHQCIPIRIQVEQFHFSKNAKRILKKNVFFSVFYGHTAASKEAFLLYKQHKTRFPSERNEDTYADFSQSFFPDFHFSQVLSIYDKQKLVSMTHFDICEKVLSAVYTYYDRSYEQYSLGKYAIYSLLLLAKKQDLRHLYLGYYIHNCKHMNYKALYKPLEYCIGNEWQLLDGEKKPEYFHQKIKTGFHSIPILEVLPES